MQEKASERVPEDPIAHFKNLFEQYRATGEREPGAMALTTVDRSTCRPSTRMVLLKQVSEEGFTFYTNLTSRKGRELQSNPFVALTFHWDSLRIQVRVEGRAQAVTPEVADAYFASRVRGSQIGAWASKQSSVLESREELQARIKKYEERYPDTVPRPEHWSGFVVIPDRIEFWRGLEHRLHDRLIFKRDACELNASWKTEKLFP